jgi:ABC-2 type transport system permease protein
MNVRPSQAFTADLDVTPADTLHMPWTRTAGAYLTEARSETLRMLRTPVFSMVFLCMPALLYLLFRLIIGRGQTDQPSAAAYLFLGFLVVGLMGPGMFGFGIVVAQEREQGLIRLKRALPMPPGAYLFAKVFMTTVFAAAVFASLVAAALLSGLKLPAGQIGALALIAIPGSAPFCAIGLFIGVYLSSRSAMAVVNTVYQVMIHLSGLFYALPAALLIAAQVWPSRHLQQLMLNATGRQGGDVWIHVVALVATTALFATMSWRRLARVG